VAAAALYQPCRSFIGRMVVGLVQLIYRISMQNSVDFCNLDRFALKFTHFIPIESLYRGEAVITVE
jgi:hypothetical protein